MRRIFRLLLPLAWLVSSGCFDSTPSTTGVIHPTLLGVSPAHFLGNVPCLDSKGAMRRYSATIFDVSEDLPVDVFELPSSSLITCQHAVTFSFVVPGHRYVARIRGYDRDDLQKQRTGSPHAVDSEGYVVAPRWTTECGGPVASPGQGGAGGSSADDSAMQAAGQGGATPEQPETGFQLRGVTSASRFTVYADHCLPLVDHGPPTDTVVSVGLQPALRSLACGTNNGEVHEFSANLEAGSASSARTGCEEQALLPGLVAGQDYRITVLAFEHGAEEPRWQTTCRATALAGTVTPASCDPLLER